MKNLISLPIILLGFFLMACDSEQASEREGITASQLQSFTLSRISLGEYHTCAVTSGGKAMCWGLQKYGRIGNGDVIYDTTRNHPSTFVMESAENPTAHLQDLIHISVGEGHSCALKAEGTVRCWGKGDSGQLGNLQTEHSGYPVVVATGEGDSTPLSGVVQIDSGDKHSCALLSSGQVRCWGSGENGRLGNRSSNDKHHPVPVLAGSNGTAPLEGVVQISSGKSHNCALLASGRMVCWGSGEFGQLANGKPDSSNRPYYDVGVPYESNYPVTAVYGSDNNAALEGLAQITTGGDRTCVLFSGGGVRCWGYEEHWEKGRDRSEELPDTVQVAAGGGHLCALSATGGVKCWGLGQYGQLGDGGAADDLLVDGQLGSPLDVVDTNGRNALGGIIHIVLGPYNSCGLTSRGTMKCWGNNNRGILGSGPYETQNKIRKTPISVVSGKNNASPLVLGTFQRERYCLQRGCVTNSIGFSLTGGAPPLGKSNAPEITVSGIPAEHSLRVYSDSACTTPVGDPLTENGPITPDGPLAEGTHSYYFTLSDDKDTLPCSGSFFTYLLDQTAPASPGISLAVASGTSTTPTVSVTGVAFGDSVTLYSDANCSEQAAAATHRDATSFQVSASALGDGPGSYQFYARAVDAAGNWSPCSTGASYTLLSSQDLLRH